MFWPPEITRCTVHVHGADARSIVLLADLESSRVRIKPFAPLVREKGSLLA